MATVCYKNQRSEHPLIERWAGLRAAAVCGVAYKIGPAPQGTCAVLTLMSRVLVLVFGGVLLCHMVAAFANLFDLTGELIKKFKCAWRPRGLRFEFSFQFVPIDFDSRGYVVVHTFSILDMRFSVCHSCGHTNPMREMHW
jgi:hypothetical protein